MCTRVSVFFPIHGNSCSYRLLQTWVWYSLQQPTCFKQMRSLSSKYTFFPEQRGRISCCSSSWCSRCEALCRSQWPQDITAWGETQARHPCLTRCVFNHECWLTALHISTVPLSAGGAELMLTCSSYGPFHLISKVNLSLMKASNHKFPLLLQLNSDLLPFVKTSMGEPVLFSLFSAPVAFHRQIIGEDQWRRQLQQVLICNCALVIM